jgi:hypothetical protein
VMMEGLGEENTPELFIQEGVISDDLVIVRPETIDQGRDLMEVLNG